MGRENTARAPGAGSAPRTGRTGPSRGPVRGERRAPWARPCGAPRSSPSRKAVPHLASAGTWADDGRMDAGSPRLYLDVALAPRRSLSPRGAVVLMAPLV